MLDKKAIFLIGLVVVYGAIAFWVLIKAILEGRQ